MNEMPGIAYAARRTPALWKQPGADDCDRRTGIVGYSRPALLDHGHHRIGGSLRIARTNGVGDGAVLAVAALEGGEAFGRDAQAVQIGESAVVKVKEKSGRMVRLVFFTDEPVHLLADGLVPARFTLGITGEPHRILEPVSP